MTTLAVSALAACDVPYPEGAYTPPDVEADDVQDDDIEDDDVDTGDTTKRDAGKDGGTPRPVSDAKISRPDSGGPRPSDGGSSGRDAGGDSQEPVESGPAALAGRYLMRIDVYSTVRKTSTPSLNVQNRMSALVLTDLEVDGDQLRGAETVCDLTFEHKCATGCASWTTAVDDEIVTKYFGAAYPRAPRSYTLSGKELRGAEGQLLFGFEPSEGGGALPTSDSDPRLWNVAAGPGLYANTSITPKVLGSATRPISCQISTVQRLKMSFSGELSSIRPDALKDVTFVGSAQGIEAELLRVGPSNVSQCNERTFDSSESSNEKVTVRLMPYDEDDCPGNWDSVFPPSPRFM